MMIIENQSSGDFESIAVVVLFVLTFVDRLGRQFHEKGRTGNTIFLCRPCAEIGQLAAFRAEWTPGIAFPVGRSTAKRAKHARILPQGGKRRRQLGRRGYVVFA